MYNKRIHSLVVVFHLMYLKVYSVFVVLLRLVIGKKLLEVITTFKLQFHYPSRKSLKLEFLHSHSSFYNLDYSKSSCLFSY